MIDIIVVWLSSALEISETLAQDIIFSLITVLVVALLRAGIVQIIEKRVDDVKVRHQWRRNTTYISGGVTIILFITIWAGEMRSLATFAGLLTAGIAIALRDPITNIIGWVFILSRQTFEPGDRIQIGEHRGDVLDVRLFQTVLLELGGWVEADQSTGRVLYVPNAQIFTKPVSNYHSGMGFVWNEIHLLLTFESDWERARDIMQEIADNHEAPIIEPARRRLSEAQSHLPIVYTNLKPTIYMRVVEHGIQLTMRYLCDPRRRRSTEHGLWTDILRAFDQEPDIVITPPTHRLYRSDQ